MHGGDSSAPTSSGYRGKLFVTISSSKSRTISGHQIVPKFFNIPLMSRIFKDALAKEEQEAILEGRAVDFDLSNRTFYCIENIS